MITNENLSDIRSFNPEQYLTTTLYLPMEGSVQSNYAIELKELIKKRKQELEKQELSPEVRKSAETDLKEISDYVNLKFSRPGVRTLIVFSCSAQKFWKVLTVNFPIRSELALAGRPYLAPLNFQTEEYRRFLVIAIERAKARMFEVHAGEIVEYTSILDEVPGKVKMGGFGGTEERRIKRHIEDHVRRHFKHVADAAYDLFKKGHHDYLFLCGTDQNTHEFHHYLHNTLHDRIAGSFTEDMNAPAHTILDRVMKLERQISDIEEQRLLERLFNQVNSGGLGIVGLDSTIRALQQGQVNFLVVQQGFGKSGFRCTNCSSLATNNGSCDYCGSSTEAVKDIVDEAVQEAMDQGCQVKWIAGANSRLSAAGNIGAMLRFKV